MVLAILNESELILSDDAVEQIVDQVQCIEINRYFQLIPLGPRMSTTELTVYRDTSVCSQQVRFTPADFFTGTVKRLVAFSPIPSKTSHSIHFEFNSCGSRSIHITKPPANTWKYGMLTQVLADFQASRHERGREDRL
jgi:hypothetical protein